MRTIVKCLEAGEVVVGGGGRGSSGQRRRWRAAAVVLPAAAAALRVRLSLRHFCVCARRQSLHLDACCT
jgi:hypothetical protein